MHILLPAGATLVALALAVWGGLRTRQSPSWLAFSAGMLLLAADEALRAALASFAAPAAAFDLERWRLVLAGLRPGVWLLFSLGYARGNAAESFRRWRAAAIAIFALWAAIAAAGWKHLLVAVDARGAEEVAPATPVGPAGLLLQILIVFGLAAALENLERTLRAAVGTMRWRVKFMVIGLGAILVMGIFSAGQALLYSSVSWRAEALNTLALLVGGLTAVVGMERTRRATVDLYPSPGGMRGSLTILVTGLYLVLAGVVAQLSLAVGGIDTMPLKSFLIMVALLAASAVLLSDRVKLWWGEFAMRYLHRPRYDYGRIWRECAEKTGSIVAPARLCREMAELLSTALEALSVTVWRMDGTRGQLALAASTSLPHKDGIAGPVLDAAAARRLAEDAQPFNLEAVPAPWAEALRAAAPATFPHGGDRMAMPLCAGGHLLGVAVVGDRVRGRPFTNEDRRLLRTIGDHLGASLLNLRLSERLLESREMEAFQKMSAFFIHDLKNTASSLSLLLENFRVHSENPAFRQDALKSIEASVTRLRDLIGRLGRLRETPETNKQPCQVAEVVDEALAQIAIPRGVRLLREGAPPPPITADRRQIASVVTNLVLNALQALPPEGGEISVSTATRERQTIIAVRDNGRGMPREFVENSLFHPFRTTKSGGMGIGLFQSRMLVESHGGRIEVESEEGRGSVFRVVFPAAGA